MRSRLCYCTSKLIDYINKHRFLENHRFEMAVFLILSILAILDVTFALPTGAPTDACVDMIPTPGHFVAPQPCEDPCPFSLQLTAVDGGSVSSLQQQMYRCGSQHTITLQTSDVELTFRGFAIQSRASTTSFSESADFVGEFSNPLPPTESPWRIWACDSPSATHSDRSDKTSVELTWVAPGGPATDNITLWFSVVRTFLTFHIQIEGLVLRPDPAFCGVPDVDECMEETDDCVDGATCVNNDGSFTCTCLPGFTGDGRASGSGCTDVDECTSETDDCVDGATCVNTDGSFTCICPPGFTGDGRASGSGCTDVDECTSEEDDCVDGATCVNNDGSFTCTCSPGFTGDGRASGSGCTDVDECTSETDDCVDGATCVNTDGSFTCICPPGFTGDGRASGSGCTDVDECTSETDDCVDGATCVNTDGSFTCTCPPGFTGDGRASGSGCTDVDECTSEEDDCVDGATCVNTDGSFTCICPSGFIGDGRASGSGCTDFDECFQEADDCVGLATCVNTDGSFTCTCPSGFTGDGRASGSGCTDVDECTSETDDCVDGATCVNNDGSFTCTCPSGFVGDGRASGSGCTDVDECTSEEDDCVDGATCVNSDGSFTCSCPSGFTGNGRASGSGCTDVDECTSEEDDCVDGATCVNNDGSFTCTCPPGFTGDGRASGSGCTDVDECTSEEDDCVDGATCENTDGSFTCTCPSGFNGDGRASGSGCTDIDECTDGTDNCESGTTCVNTPGSFLCVTDFTVTCGFGLPGPNGPLSVTCTVVGGEVDTVICNYDNGEIVEECALENMVSFSRFSSGLHSLDITVNSIDGQVATFGPISFRVPQPLVIECVFGAVSGRTDITCTTNKLLFLPPVCTIDRVLILNCNISNIVVTTEDFDAGNLTLFIEAVDVEEVSGNLTLNFVLIDVPFEIECGLVPVSQGSSIQVSCTTEGGEAVTVICNYDNGELVEACDLDTTIDFSRFDPGPHTLVITVTSDDGQMASFDPIAFDVPEPEMLILNFINDTPRIEGNNITAELEISGPVESVRCALTGFPYQDCSSGSVTFSNVPLRDSNNRPYILRVAATTAGGIRMVIRTPVQPEQEGFCNAQFINDGVSVSGNTATVEFSPVGLFESFLCSLDRGELQPCISPQVFSDLSVGPHRLKVVPFIEECGRSRYPAHIRFTIQPES